ncbi:MAG: hypothetical protein H7A36_03315 [Chlamydiales bacterium]|nr:hypothetical protein [Chlamydiales bacterium]
MAHAVNYMLHEIPMQPRRTILQQLEKGEYSVAVESSFLYIFARTENNMGVEIIIKGNAHSPKQSGRLYATFNGKCFCFHEIQGKRHNYHFVDLKSKDGKLDAFLSQLIRQEIGGRKCHESCNVPLRYNTRALGVPK